MFAMPGVSWLILFFVVSVYAVMAVAFGTVDPILRTAIPAWNPLHWDVTAMNKVLDRVFGGDLGTVFVRTFWFVGLSLVGCILIGYPVAYFVARKASKYRGLVLAMLVLPFWISYLMRMMAWTNLLAPDGMVNNVLHFLHLQNAPRTWLDGNWYTVVIGLIYGYVPFFILPLYSTLERIDGRLIEAGRDLGASATQTFVRVTLPLSVPGLIERYLLGTSQPQTGASLVLILMAFLVVLMAYYLYTTIHQQRLADR
jgi:ABC-type spermidine/putrescine transport system permease subunit I